MSAFGSDQTRERVMAICRLAAAAYERNDYPAMAHYADEALSINPDHPDALQLRGLAYRGMGDDEMAIQFTKRAVQKSPNSASVQENYGSVLVSANRTAEGVKHLEASIKLDSRFLPAHRALAKALLQLGRTEQALKAANKGLEKFPDDVALVGTRGMLFRALDKRDEAFADLSRCVELDPNNASANLNLGNYFGSFGEVDKALEYWNRAIELKGEYLLAENNILGVTYEAGFVDDALELLDGLIKRYPQDPSLKKIRSTVSNYSINKSRQEQQELTEVSAAALEARAGKLTPMPVRSFQGRKIRIGYLSGDFRNNPVGYFVENALKYHDRTKFETMAISLLELPDEITVRLKKAAQKWITIPNLPPHEVAEKIRKLDLDIIVDLFGYTGEFELFSLCYKPAPIVASWIGYFATTKLKAIDYVIGDRFVTPDSEQAYFSEKLIRHPSCYLCYSPAHGVSEPASPPFEKNGFITFGNYATLSKLNSELLDCWAEVLSLVPNSRLLLKSKFSRWPKAVDRIVEPFLKRGIDRERIQIDTQSKRGEYLESFAKMDIWIDTFPFASGTTACDALYMGVPVVTLHGDRFCGCIATSILESVGHPELVASDKKEFVKKIVELAGDQERLRCYRKSLRQDLQNSIVMDGESHTRELEQLFVQMIEEKLAEKQKEQINAAH